MLSPYFQNQLTEAGLDEAGRGCLAGPVFAAAVILPENFFHPLLNDSKQVTEQNRNELRKVIETEAISYAVASVDNNEIDAINILRASFKAMHLAVDALSKRPKLLLVDGNRFIKYKRTAHKCIVKGDSLYASIAAASILAKTYRDEYMLKLHDSFPHYSWSSNKGYATEEHRNAIIKHGLTSFHRRSFQCMPEEQMELEF